MKHFITIFFLIPVIALAQLSSEQEAQIDSLHQVIKNAGHDTTIINAWRALDNIIYITDPKLDFQLNKRIDSLCSLNLQKKLDPKEKLTFLKSQGFALNNMGIIYMNRGEYDKAIDYYTRSLKIIEELGNKRDMAITLNNIGIIYQDQGDHEQAINYYNKSLKIKEEINDKKGIGTSLNSIGLVYQHQKDYEKALEYFYKSLKIKEEAGDKVGVATSLSNIGNVAIEQKEFDKASSFLERSLEIFEEIGDQQGIAVSTLNFGFVFLEQGRLNKALEFGKRSLNTARKVDASKQVKEAAELLWRVNKKLHNYISALEMYELYIDTRDSLESEENKKEIIRQEYKYEYEKKAAADSIKAAEAAKVKDAELAAEKAENKRHQVEANQQKQQKYFLYGGLALALIFGGFIFNRFRVTRKQKDIIENQKFEVDRAYDKLEEKNSEILDSINYAKRIQSAILPPDKIVKKYLENAFVFYEPKDIVAGDFYWMEPVQDGVLFAAADCTGHGVPGAMVSVVCNNALNRSVREFGLTDPGKILDKTREIVIQEFEKSEEEVKDGMDIALISLKKSAQSEFERERDASTPLSAGTHTQNSSSLCYSGAHNPLWIICSKKRSPEVILSLSKGGEGESGQTDKKQFSVFEDPESDHVLIEIKANKQPIGKFDHGAAFESHEVHLNEGDTVYIFSDGFADQFGGEKGKKFKSKNLKKLLLSVQNETMDRQKELINDSFERWKGDIEQLDDVCVIGVRL